MRVTGAKRNQKLTVVDDTTTQNVSGEKATIHNVFIIDASGSMAGSKYVNAISGVNELLNGITKDSDNNNTVTIVEFEEKTIKVMLDTTDNIPVSYTGMGTGGMTPLNQAIGETLETMVKTRNKKYGKGDKVLVSIFTDGGENSSRGKYSKPSELSKFIKELENDGFTITFIGTKEEVHYAINTLSMDMTNTLVHTNTAASIKSSFDRTLKSRQVYAKSVARGEDVKFGFYSKTVEEDKK